MEEGMSKSMEASPCWSVLVNGGSSLMSVLKSAALSWAVRRALPAGLKKSFSGWKTFSMKNWLSGGWVEVALNALAVGSPKEPSGK